MRSAVGHCDIRSSELNSILVSKNQKSNAATTVQFEGFFPNLNRLIFANGCRLKAHGKNNGLVDFGLVGG